MEDPTAVEENGANQSAVQVDEEDVGGIASLEMEKAIADDFNNYDCFMQPFHTLNEEKQKELENTPCDNVDQQQLSSKDTEVCQTGNESELKEISTGRQTSQTLGTGMEERIQGYQYDILRLKDMLEEKMKEAEDIIAEKEELEFNVQNALHKLWAKEEELHAHRKSSLEREKSLLDRLRKESTRSEGLELQVPSLTKQKDTLQKQVYWLEQQLSLIEGATQQRKRELENKLPEIEGNNECLKKMTC
ncbi:uncharacterized protein LOC114964268 [Acropora millepora]|uniref:uncharacterized protein LOC114964268 n=1 Tax=Acropora millepora TaxID=45264 RepID=UPI001CF458F5|nr:uncharacterized protein LOC114964268 [Acropora millepora]